MGEETPAPPGIGFADQMVTMEEEQSELDKIFERMLDPNNLTQNTNLSKVEAVKFARLAVLASKYDWDTLKEELVEALQHRVSIQSAGRKDAVRLATRYDDREDRDDRSGFAKFFGGGRRG